MGTLLALFLIIWGAVLLSIVLLARAPLERIWHRLHGNHAEGVVVEVAVEKGEERSATYTPTVEFVTRTGERRVVKVESATSQSYSVGRTVLVFYRPQDARYASIGNWEEAIRAIVAAPVFLAAGLKLVTFGFLTLIGVG